RVVDLEVRELEIRERGEVERAPVDDAIRAVEPALVPEVDEEPHDGADVGVVHREALATVVERGADTAELEHDLAAVLAQPVPDERDERLAAEVLARLALRGQVLLDRILRRDAGMVVAGLKEHVVALHPARARANGRCDQAATMPAVCPRRAHGPKRALSVRLLPTSVTNSEAM